jgi:hypothetical protein
VFDVYDTGMERDTCPDLKPNFEWQLREEMELVERDL